MAFLLGLDTQPMEAKTVTSLPDGPGWQFEPKWDGFRCVAFKGGGAVDLRAKSGKSLSRYFPEMVAALSQARADDFVLDGELAIPRGDSLSFGALQDRVHPAESRVRKLAAETPALLIAFDCLATRDAGSLLGVHLPERRAALERVIRGVRHEDRIRLSPFTRDSAEAQRWLQQAHGALDGVIAKRLDAPYASGKRDMLKLKTHRTADCVVGGFRYATGTRQVGSLLLGLYDADGRLDHVGFTSAISNADRPALTRRVEALLGGEGFTGDAPGGPSRWATDRSAEWAGAAAGAGGGGELRSGHRRPLPATARCWLRWRPDKAPRPVHARAGRRGTAAGAACSWRPVGRGERLELTLSHYPPQLNFGDHPAHTHRVVFRRPG